MLLRHFCQFLINSSHTYESDFFQGDGVREAVLAAFYEREERGYENKSRYFTTELQIFCGSL